jgi:ribonuclease P protein component
VLPRNARLTSPSDFAKTTKSGVRVTSTNFVGYLYIQSNLTTPARAGLIIGKSVGGSVVRHHLSRQVRHAIAPQISTLPEGSLLVIRALKASSGVGTEITSLISSLIARHEKIARKSEASI